MRIFRRSRDRDERAAAEARHAIDAFWAWWAGAGRALAEDSIGGGPNDALVEGMSRKVTDIHPGLAWELSPGSTSSHCLVVSPEGDSSLRATARRWAKAAPPADAVWEFADTRQAAPDAQAMELQLGGQTISFGDVVVGARREGHRLDVSVHHPSFPTLDERSRLTVTFLALDNALGETDVELWVGEVVPAQVAPLDGFGLSGLRAVVRDLKAENTDEDGQPAWAILRADGDGGPVLAMTQIPLSSAMAPDLDTHAGVFVPYDDQTETGLPGVDALAALRELEDSVTQALGDSGRVVAHQSQAGVRLLHVYLDSTAEAVPLLARTVDPWPRDVRIRVTPDPGWANVAHLRT